MKIIQYSFLLLSVSSEKSYSQEIKKKKKQYGVDSKEVKVPSIFNKKDDQKHLELNVRTSINFFFLYS